MYRETTKCAHVLFESYRGPRRVEGAVAALGLIAIELHDENALTFLAYQKRSAI